MIYLFSYGTLRNPDIQKALFQRHLTGWPDILLGYTLSDEKVYSRYPTIKKAFHSSEQLSGIVYEITPEELRKTDIYESDAYMRILAKLQSGKEAWVYIAKES